MTLSTDIYPQAPPDQAGGFMVIGYRNGTDTHHMRVHVLPFSTSNFIIGGGTPSVGTDDGNHDYAYTPDRPAGMEAGIADTFQAFVNAIKPGFSNTWTFTLDALYQVVNGQANEVFPVPNVTPIAGASANGSATGQLRAHEVVWNFKTAKGNRARLIHIAKDSSVALGVPVTVSANSGGTNDQKMVAYLSGSATGVVAHDGQKFQSSAHVTYAINRRLRRHYGYA